MILTTTKDSEKYKQYISMFSSSWTTDISAYSGVVDFYNAFKKTNQTDLFKVYFDVISLLPYTVYKTLCLNTIPSKSQLNPSIYASVNLFSIGSDNGLSPIRRQDIILTNAGLLQWTPNVPGGDKSRHDVRITQSSRLVYSYLHAWNRMHPQIMTLQFIPRNMHTVLLCFALLWLGNRS